MGLRKKLSLPTEGFCHVNWFDGFDWNISKIHTSQMVTVEGRLVHSLAKACLIDLFSSGEITLEELGALLKTEVWITMAVDSQGRMFLSDQSVVVEPEVQHVG